jgi:hypothetical protein
MGNNRRWRLAVVRASKLSGVDVQGLAAKNCSYIESVQIVFLTVTNNKKGKGL